MKLVIITAYLLLLAAVYSSAEIFSKKHWYDLAQKELKRTLEQKPNTNEAKNLVMVIGDGMGVTTTTAGRIYRGQQTAGMLGEEAELSWDAFPHVGFSKTYTTNAMTADSAGTATAYHMGAKTKNDVIGLDDNVVLNNCSSTQAADSLTSIAKWARDGGKSVGIVTTDMLTGASPSPLYSKAASRSWKDDSKLPLEAVGICKDIAVQLLEEENLDIQVLLGGGRVSLFGNSTADPEYTNITGNRLDGRSLALEWVAKQQEKGRRAMYAYDQATFNAALSSNVDYLLGVFEPERMQEEYQRKTQITPNEPSIAEMVERAISILSKNPKGFYLFIEGASIDMGHHENRAHKALEETLALDDAVQKVLDMTSTDDTLVVVSADHSHEFSFGGYSKRGENILGLVKTVDPEYQIDEFNNTFTVVAYGNGPGYHSQRSGLTDEMFQQNSSALYVSSVPLDYETHAGEDVAIYASGPMSHLFTGVHEQNYIPHAMAYAACIGENKDHCTSETNKGKQLSISNVLVTILAILCLSLSKQ